MPELRSLRWDHNGFVADHPEVVLYDGSGFDALARGCFEVYLREKNEAVREACLEIIEMPAGLERPLRGLRRPDADAVRHGLGRWRGWL